MSKEGFSLRRVQLLRESQQTKTVFAERKKKGRSTKIASQFLIIARGLSYDLSKFNDDFCLFFRLRKTIAKSLGKKEKI